VFVSHAWHDFHYSSFTQDTNSFSGHRLPSVPPTTIVGGLDISLKIGFYANATYTYTDRIALNDANTFYAGSYNLLGGRIGFRKVVSRWKGDVYAGIDNAANIKYSLGDDFNAALNRFYNAAAERNYFAGVSINYAFR
jgi:iron complex outermembrane receptor protein